MKNCTKRVFAALLISSAVTVGVLPLSMPVPFGVQTVCAAERTGTFANCQWTISTTGTLTITGNGSINVEDSLIYTITDEWKNKDIRDSIKKIIVDEGITDIGEQLVYNYPNVTEIVLPSTLTSIGDNAFVSLGSLKKITIPDSVTSIGYRAFEMCDSLKEITIPNSVTSIGTAAFRNCSQLTDITLPENLKEIPDECFRYCSSLQKFSCLQRYSPLDTAVLKQQHLPALFFRPR